ncbi:MAG: hypothetical protein ACR2O3_14920 [Rhizobiaceae bacterium]
MIFEQMLQKLQEEQGRISAELDKIQRVITELEELQDIQEGRGISAFGTNGPLKHTSRELGVVSTDSNLDPS